MGISSQLVLYCMATIIQGGGFVCHPTFKCLCDLCHWTAGDNNQQWNIPQTMKVASWRRCPRLGRKVNTFPHASSLRHGYRHAGEMAGCHELPTLCKYTHSSYGGSRDLKNEWNQRWFQLPFFFVSCWLELTDKDKVALVMGTDYRDPHSLGVVTHLIQFDNWSWNSYVSIAR